MSQKQIRIALASMAAVVALWLISPLLGDPPADPAISRSPLLFDARRGYEATREFVTKYPRRVFGSLEARQSTAFFRPRLEPLGFQVTFTHFDATIANRTEVGRNVLAVKQGSLSEILVIMAHYDTARPAVQGAMDDGSGIGVLVELGRALSSAPLRHSLLLVASDGEEWGMLGAADFAASFPERDRIVAALSLDYLAPGELGDLGLEVVGLERGYSPAWLRDLARKAASLERLEVLESDGFAEHLERALLISLTDQGPLLGNGIPAINLGSDSANRELEVEIRHSSEDTIEKLKIASFETFGRVAERIVRTMDDQTSTRRDGTPPFRVTAGRYLPGPIVTALHLLTFVPLVLGVWFLWSNRRVRLGPALILRELLVLGGSLLPFAAVYYAIVVLTRTGRIPVFSGYPPGSEDPVMQNPNWSIVVGLGVFLLVTAIACFLGVTFLSRKLATSGPLFSRTLTLTMLIAVAALGLGYNSYWAVAFLSLPSWVWVMTGQGRSLTSRLLNALLVVAAGVPWHVSTVFYSQFLDIGWQIVWFGILALSTGMFSPLACFLTAMTAAIGLRLAALQLVGAGD